MIITGIESKEGNNDDDFIESITINILNYKKLKAHI